MPLISSEFLVNTTVANEQIEPDMAVLKDGKIVVAWTDTSQAGNPMISTDIRAQIFNADGSKFGEEFIVNGEPETLANFDNHYQIRPSVTALSNGGFAISYHDSRATTDSTLYHTTVMQRFNEAGNKVGDPTNAFPVADIGGGQIFASTSDVIGLGNGNIVAVASTGNSNFLPADTDPNKIVMAIIDSQGEADFALGNVTLSGNQSNCKIALLSNGNYAVAYTSLDSALAGTPNYARVLVSVYAPNGALVMPEVSFPTTNYMSNLTPPQIAALDNGRFVVTWTRVPTNDEFTNSGLRADIYAQIINADGTPAGGNIAVHGSDSTYQRASVVAGQADGTFIVVWQNSDSLSSALTLHARLFNADGTPNGDILNLGSAAASGDQNPEVIALNDGRYYVSWEDGSNALGDNGSAIHGQFIDPRTAAVNWTGTSKADQFVGTDFNDRLKGGNGADKLWGGDGNDQFLRGNGSDDMSGGDGNDTYYVDAADSVYEAAGEGTDRVWANSDFTLDAGAEIELFYALNNSTVAPKVLTGNELDNRIIGSTHGDSLRGVEGADTLEGKGGNDRLEGGVGIDKITGGTDADTIVLNNLLADRDFVRDFEHSVDDFEINASLFGGGLSAGTLSAAKFEINTTGLASSSATRFIYNSSSGALYFDANGDASGQRVLIATLINNESIDATDFILV